MRKKIYWAYIFHKSLARASLLRPSPRHPCSPFRFPPSTAWVSPDDSILLPQNIHTVVTTGVPWNARVKRDKELERRGRDGAVERYRDEKKSRWMMADGGCHGRSATRPRMVPKPRQVTTAVNLRRDSGISRGAPRNILGAQDKQSLPRHTIVDRC